MSEIENVAERYARYRQTDIPEFICPHDDMFIPDVAGNMAHYMSVGRSAIDIIVSALVASGNPPIDRVLDLPCGGGRVTRHLRAFFPTASIYVSDLDQRKEKFVLETLGANQAEPNPNFIIPPPRSYDLIFVGSLVTHLDERRFRQAVKWLIEALSPDGLLIMTTHGRRYSYLQDHVVPYIDRNLWSPAKEAYLTTGFGYADYPHVAAYGASVSSPAWLMRLIESFPLVHVVALHEGAWDNNQDALVLRKRDVAPPLRR